MNPEPEPHTLAGAYVLDAVTEAEREAFAGHLGVCPECRDEIREWREVSARLAAAAAVPASADLRTSTLGAARRISQVGPRQRPAPTREAGPAPDPATVAGGPRRWWRLNLTRPLAIALAAAVAAVGVTAGVMMADARQQTAGSQQRDHMISAVLTAPDAVMLTAKVATGGTATVVMSHRMRALVFTAHGLSALPAAKAYELWLMSPTGDEPVGMLAVRSAGMADPAVISGLRSGDTLGVTIEPAAGSERPTSAPIVLIGMKTR